MDESMIEEAEGITYEGINSCKKIVNYCIFRPTKTDECNCHASRFKEALQAYLQMLEESCQGQNLPQKRSQGLFLFPERFGHQCFRMLSST
jgi:pentatricopeptide repeat protein